MAAWLFLVLVGLVVILLVGLVVVIALHDWGCLIDLRVASRRRRGGVGVYCSRCVSGTHHRDIQILIVVVGWTWDENHGGVDVVDSSMRKRK